MSNQRGLGVLTVAMLASIVGCEPAPTLGAPCAFNSDCVMPLVCSDRVCRSQCVDDRDCARGLVCALGPAGAVCTEAIDAAAPADAGPPDDAWTGIDAGSCDGIAPDKENDVRIAASTLGALSAGAMETSFGYLDHPGDVDWYVYTVTSASAAPTTNVTLSAPSSGAYRMNMSVRLCGSLQCMGAGNTSTSGNEGGETYLGCEGTGETRQMYVEHQCAAPYELWIRVDVGPTGVFACGTYILTVTQVD